MTKEIDIVEALRTDQRLACDPVVQKAADEIEWLRRVLYKMQMPENQNKFPTEFLNADEKDVVRRAVTENL